MAAASWFCLAPPRWVCNLFPKLGACRDTHRLHLWRTAQITGFRFGSILCLAGTDNISLDGKAAWGLLPAPDAVAPSVLKLFILRPFSIAHLPCATSQLRAQQCPLPGVLCKGVALPIYHGPCMCSGKSQSHCFHIFTLKLKVSLLLYSATCLQSGNMLPWLKSWIENIKLFTSYSIFKLLKTVISEINRIF